MRAVSFFAVSLLAVACGSSQPPVTFMSNEQPTGQSGDPNVSLSKSGSHIENPNGKTADLGEDEQVEPEHPLADSKQERALVHIHGPKNVICSGVVLAPKLVATTQRCVKGLDHGASTLGGDKDYRIEVASSALSVDESQRQVRRPPEAASGTSSTSRSSSSTRRSPRSWSR